MKITTVGELLKHIRYDLLDQGYQDIGVSIDEEYFAIELYDMREVCVVYDKVNDTIVIEGVSSKVDFDEIKDLYLIGDALKKYKDIIVKDLYI